MQKRNNPGVISNDLRVDLKKNSEEVKAVLKNFHIHSSPGRAILWVYCMFNQKRTPHLEGLDLGLMLCCHYLVFLTVFEQILMKSWAAPTPN